MTTITSDKLNAIIKVEVVVKEEQVEELEEERSLS
jgi:hypothetical protein